MDLKRVPKWAWVAAGLVAVAVFYYMHKRAQANSTAATATGAGSDTSGGVDESQLSSDIAAQLAAALGGTPPGTDSGAVQPQDDSALIEALLQMLGQSQAEFGQFATSMYGSGIYSGGAYGPSPAGQDPSAQLGQGGLQAPSYGSPGPSQPAPVYSPIPSGFYGTAPVGGVYSAAYNPSSGYTLTPQGITIPSTNYGTPSKPLTGPSIFAFK